MIARLTGTIDVAPNTKHFEFEAVDWDARFVPGQFLSVTSTFDGAAITRAYSIASPPVGGTFAFCSNLVPDGRMSPHLFGLPVGGEISFAGPYGTFVLRPEPVHAIFVATGTGIAPFRSMLLQHLAERPAQQFTLVFGVRSEEGLLYHEEFLLLASRYPNFRYLPTLTRAGEAWQGMRGRVQPHVLEVVGGRRDVDVYICGMREMVDELRVQLKAIGLDRKRMIYEKYD